MYPLQRNTRTAMAVRIQPAHTVHPFTLAASRTATAPVLMMSSPKRIASDRESVADRPDEQHLAGLIRRLFTNPDELDDVVHHDARQDIALNSRLRLRKAVGGEMVDVEAKRRAVEGAVIDHRHDVGAARTANHPLDLLASNFQDQVLLRKDGSKHPSSL